MSSEVNGVWEHTKRGARSLSWTDLEGDNLVRVVYLDESGISANERVAVVAGVIVHGDRDWMRVHDHIRDLIDEYVPDDDRSGFHFHAKDLFHGSGSVFARNKYSLERAHECLEMLLSTPAFFQIPVVFGHTRQTDLETMPALARERGSHALAFAFCAIAAERYMRTVPNTEVATLIAENNNSTRKTITNMHRLLRGTRYFEGSDDILLQLLQIASDCLPIRRIVDTVSFAEKDDAFLLQLADACSLVLRYYYEGRQDVGRFVDALTANNPSMLGDRERAAGLDVVAFAPIPSSASPEHPPRA